MKLVLYNNENTHYLSGNDRESEQPITVVYFIGLHFQHFSSFRGDDASIHVDVFLEKTGNPEEEDNYWVEVFLMNYVQICVI